MDIDGIVKKHVSYTKSHDIYEICKPLFNKFGINFFSYVRLYGDGSALVLISDGEWHRCAFKNKYVTTGPMLGRSGIQLWDNYSSTKVKEVLNEVNLNNGIMIYNKKNEEYVEFFELASSIKGASVVEFYFNNMDLLEKFLIYFKNKADKLIKEADKNRIIVPSEMLFSTVEEVTYEDFLYSINTKKIKFEVNTQNIIFSRREYDCLVLAAKGKTMKEIGGILNISHRTVNTHLDSAKEKTNCHSKAKLIDLFWRKLSSYFLNI